MIYKYYISFYKGNTNSLLMFLMIMKEHWKSMIEELLMERELKSYIEVDDLIQDLALSTIEFFNTKEYIVYTKTQICNRYARICKKVIKNSLSNNRFEDTCISYDSNVVAF